MSIATVALTVGGSESLAAPGDHVWSAHYGDAARQEVLRIRVDGAGNVVALGRFWGSIDFGGGALTSAGESDLFVVKQDGNGSHLWSTRFGSSAGEQPIGLAIDSAGSVLISGSGLGTVDFGGGGIGGSGDTYLVKLDAAGNHVWSQGFDTSLFGVPAFPQVATDSFDNVILAGTFAGTVDFGGGPLTADGTSDTFVAKFDAAGTHVWSKRYGTPTDVTTTMAIAVDGSNNVLLTGDNLGTADFGGGELVSSSRDIYLVKLDSSGAHVWSKVFAAPAEQRASGLAVGPLDAVFVSGWIAFSVDFGGGPLSAGSSSDAYIAKFDSAGNHVWSQNFGSTLSIGATRVAIDGNGGALITGWLRGTGDFGGGPLTALSREVFAASYDAGGVHIWSRRFGLSGADTDGDGCIDVKETGPSHVLGGQRDPLSPHDFYDVNATTKVDTIDIGLVRANYDALGPVPPEDVIYDRGVGAAPWAPGPPDTKINAIDVGLVRASFNDDCRVVSEQTGEDITVNAAGEVLLGGVFDWQADFGGGALMADGVDAFIAKLEGAP